MKSKQSKTKQDHKGLKDLKKDIVPALLFTLSVVVMIVIGQCRDRHPNKNVDPNVVETVSSQSPSDYTSETSDYTSETSDYIFETPEQEEIRLRKERFVEDCDEPEKHPEYIKGHNHGFNDKISGRQANQHEGFDPLYGTPPMYSKGYMAGWKKGEEYLKQLNLKADTASKDTAIVNISQAYKDGYDAGYEDGCENDYKTSYAPKKKDKKYLADYEEGYNDGYESGVQDYEEDFYDAGEFDAFDEW